MFTGSPGAEGRLLSAWQAHDPETEREIGARAATSWPTGWSFLVAATKRYWADRAVASTVPGSVLRAMACTGQAYALAAAAVARKG